MHFIEINATISLRIEGEIMAIPDYEKLMYPVLKLLGDDKEYSGIELSNIIADKLKLTEQILLQSKKMMKIYLNRTNIFH